MSDILKKFRTGEGSGLVSVEDNRDPSVFFRTAEPILREVSGEVYDQVIPELENYEGKWHPLGFMAWKLGNIATVGTLRLHIWPADLRRESPRGPKIHDHAWHISSLVMDGDYTDTIFDVDEQGVVLSEEERKERGLLRVFSPRFSDTSAALQTDGTCATAEKVEDRLFKAGSMHSIETGIFHITDIPLGRMVTTLLIESPSVEAHPRILMDTPMDALTDPKHDIPQEDALFAKQQVMNGGFSK